MSGITQAPSGVMHHWAVIKQFHWQNLAGEWKTADSLISHILLLTHKWSTLHTGLSKIL